MMIWRNLDVKLLGQLLVEAAEQVSAERTVDRTPKLVSEPSRSQEAVHPDAQRSRPRAHGIGHESNKDMKRVMPVFAAAAVLLAATSGAEAADDKRAALTPYADIAHLDTRTR